MADKATISTKSKVVKTTQKPKRATDRGFEQKAAGV